MSRVPHNHLAPASGQTKPRRSRFRLSATVAFCLLALLSLAAFGVSAQLANPADMPPKQATLQASTGKGANEAEFVPGDILVRYRDNVAANRAEVAETSLLKNGRAMKVNVERFDGSRLVPGLRRARVQPEDTLAAIAALKEDPEVLYAEPNYILHQELLPNDPRLSEMWGLKNTGQGFNGQAGGTAGADIDAELAWNITTGSSSVVVGIIDTGIDINHPDLADNIWVNPAEIANNGVDDDANGKIDDINGWDFAHNDKTVYDGGSSDPDTHGTHVAGTIGAKGNNGVGVTGINWNVKLMPLKFLNTDKGTGDTLNAIAAFDYAKMMRDRGVNLRVINCSWGGGGFNPALLEAINRVGQSGILVVAASGNDGVSTDDFPHYPSSLATADVHHPSSVPATNLISVGRTNHFDNVSSTSNFGARTVHIGAPGFSILSTTPNNTYSFLSGTSMATPHVTGVAALILALNPGIPLQRLRAALIYSGEAASGVVDKFQQARRLNANLALRDLDEADTTPPVISGLGIAAQNGRNLTLQFATGDDGTGGPPASLYSLSFSSSNGAQYYLASVVPTTAGPQNLSVNIPPKNTSGTLVLTVADNAGNQASANLLVTVSDAGSLPYAVSLTPATPLSTGGTPLSLVGDDKYLFDYSLPFDFPYFGKVMRSVTISTNGVLYFSPPQSKTPPPGAPQDEIAADAINSTAELNLQSMIAGMWDDLRTDRFGGDVFVVRPDANRIIFRWQGSTFNNDTQPVNFEIELRTDGTIQTRYGAGNAGVQPIVGISGGETDAFSGGPEIDFVAATHTSTNADLDLNNAQTVTFAPQATAQPCTYSLSQMAQSFSSGAASGTVNVTAGAGCSWTATNNDPSFITITSGAGGTGNGTLGFSVTANTGAARTGTLTIAGQTFTVTQAAATSGVQLSQASYAVSEGQAFLNVVVTRTGDTSNAMTIRYATSDATDANFRCDPATPGQATGVASRKCDYHIAAGKLRFAAGETTKQLTLSIIDDVFVEPSETFTLTLSDLTITVVGINVSIPLNISVPVTITDNDVAGAPNPIDQTSFYVRQLYVDLLSREPDPAGLSGWTSRINLCGQPGQAPPPCDRVTVGGDGFLRSGEFFDRQFFVLRLYRTGLGRILRYDEISDLAYVSGFLTDTDLELNKQDLVAELMSRPEFAGRYNPLSNAAFVPTLLQTAGVSVPQTVQDAWIAALDNGSKTRAMVFREISERPEVSSRYLHEAQVVSAYYGFFTRNPDGAYFNYLQRLDAGEITLGDLANAFINAAEYRQRFGP